MPAIGVGKLALFFVEYAIPHGEVHVVVALHLEDLIEACQHL